MRHRAVTSAASATSRCRWSGPTRPGAFVTNSLIPAAVRGVELSPPIATAHVAVGPGQLSLAIGRGGENARLAARLTGWRIDIAGSAKATAETEESAEEGGDPG